MKRFLSALVLAVAFTACTTPGGTAPTEQRQSAINATYTSYQALDQAILAADAAVKAGKLKGADAKRALAGFQTAKVGLDAALSALVITAAPAASAAGVK